MWKIYSTMHWSTLLQCIRERERRRNTKWWSIVIVLNFLHPREIPNTFSCYNWNKTTCQTFSKQLFIHFCSKRMNEFDAGSWRIIIQFVCRFFHPFFSVFVILSFNHFKYGINNARFRLNIFNRMCFFSALIYRQLHTPSSPDTFIHSNSFLHSSFILHSPNVIFCVVCVFVRIWCVSCVCILRIFIRWFFVLREREREQEHWIEVACTAQKRTHTVACVSRTIAHILAYRQAGRQAWVWMHRTRTILCLDWIELVAMLLLLLLPLLSRC